MSLLSMAHYHSLAHHHITIKYSWEIPALHNQFDLLIIQFDKEQSGLEYLVALPSRNGSWCLAYVVVFRTGEARDLR